MLKAKKDFSAKPRKQKRWTLYVLSGWTGFFILSALTLCALLFIDELSAKTSGSPQQASAVSESPRKDLYDQITHRTGVSLRQLFDLVFQRGNRKHRRLIWARLSTYTDQKGIRGIHQDIEQQVQALKAYCDQKKKAGCYPQIDDLKKEQENLTQLQRNVQKDRKLALYYHLLILTHAVKTDIFKKANSDFARACPLQKINTDTCLAQMREIRGVYDIADRLTQAALARSRNKRTNKVAGHLDQLITTYE